MYRPNVKSVALHVPEIIVLKNFGQPMDTPFKIIRGR